MRFEQPPLVVALTAAGEQLGRRIQRLLQSQATHTELVVKPKPFTEQVQAAFQQRRPLILICATGIAVRTLAPVLVSKKTDPPVLVLDERGQFVIPLLSGHEGGANEWGRQLAELLGAQWVTTTANHYTQPIYTVGMGCERGCAQAVLDELLQACLQQVGLNVPDISGLASIELKADEVGLIELASGYDWPFTTYSAEVLRAFENQLSVRSDYVFKTVGVYGVAESAALQAAQILTGASAELVLPKQKNLQATCAIARSYPVT